MILLLFLTAIILLLCFIPKSMEGFYSDKDIYSAITTIQKLKSKAEKLKSTIGTISKVELGVSEVISELRPVLDTKKDDLFKNGVVNYVKDVSDRLSAVQEDAVYLETLLDTLKEYNGVILAYIDKLDNIKVLLKEIPDS